MRAVHRQTYDKRQADIAKVGAILPPEKKAKFVFLALMPLLRLFAFFFTWDEDERRMRSLLDLVLYSAQQAQACNVLHLALADGAERQSFLVLLRKLVSALLRAGRTTEVARLLLALQASLFLGPPDYRPRDAQRSAGTIAQLLRRTEVLSALTASVLPPTLRRQEASAVLSSQEATEFVLLCCAGLEACSDADRHEPLTCLLSTPRLAEFLCESQGELPRAVLQRVASLVEAAASARFGVPHGRVGASAKLMGEVLEGMPRQAWLLSNLLTMLEKFILPGGNQAEVSLWLTWICRAKERGSADAAADEHLAKQLERVQGSGFVRALLHGVGVGNEKTLLAVCRLYFGAAEETGSGKPPAEVLQTLAFATPFVTKLSPLLVGLMRSESVEAAFKELGPPALNSPLAVQLHAFCAVYAVQMGPMYDSEFLGSANPLSVKDVEQLAVFLNRLAYYFVTNWPDQSSLGPSAKALRNSLTSLISLLYNRHRRKPFLQAQDAWIVPESRCLLRKAPVVDLGADAREDEEPGASQQEAAESPMADEEGAATRMVPAGSAAPEGAAASGTASAVLEAILAEIPHVLPFRDRVVLLHSAILSDQEARLGTRGPWTQAALAPHRIRRNYLVEDAFEAFEALSEGNGLRDVFRVEFVAPDGSPESGVDGGGLFKEFMIHVCRTMFDPNFGLFTNTSDQTLYPSSSAFALHGRKAADLYSFLGKVVGKAIYELFLLEPMFSRTFLNRLLGRINEVDDVAALDKELHRNLLRIKETEKVEELGLTFSVSHLELGKVLEHDLLPGGRDIPVTKDNLTRYIHLVANYKTNNQLERQTNAFLKGLQCVVPLAWLKMFDPYELNSLISGTTAGFDVQDLRRNTVYAGGYRDDSPAVVWLWEMLERMEPEDKGRFLMFATSCSRAPLLGFAHLQPKFCVHRVPDSVRLPTASTCANLLKLPDYVNSTDLNVKVLQAIRAEAGFDLS